MALGMAAEASRRRSRALTRPAADGRFLVSGRGRRRMRSCRPPTSECRTPASISTAVVHRWCGCPRATNRDQARLPGKGGCHASFTQLGLVLPLSGGFARDAGGVIAPPAGLPPLRISATRRLPSPSAIAWCRTEGRPYATPPSRVNRSLVPRPSARGALAPRHCTFLARLIARLRQQIWYCLAR